MSAGVYVHIPFCVKKCNYCDFNSTDKGDHLKSKYMKTLVEEIREFQIDEEADTAFIGGGTPTSVDRESLIEVVNAVYERFPNIKEFTIEVNPKTMDYEGFCALKKAGVNRISFGLQSVNNNELKVLGRIHTYEDFVKTYEDCRNAGFDNINIDLMFSLPDQTMESFKHTLKTVAELKPEHISCYSLIIEEGTPFYDMELNLPDEETDRKMYEYMVDYLSDWGYRQYEISNFARVNKECAHNIKYWKRDNYYGFGAGACSLVDDYRYTNPYGIGDYMTWGEGVSEHLSGDDILSEHIFLRLRMTEGIDLAEFKNTFGFSFEERYKDIIDKYVKQGLMELDTHCRLTLSGISVSNVIMAEFV